MRLSLAEYDGATEPPGEAPEAPDLPGRRLRLAILLRAFDDVRTGGRWGWEARRWLLSDDEAPGGLGARQLMEEAGLNVRRVRLSLIEQDFAKHSLS